MAITFVRSAYTVSGNDELGALSLDIGSAGTDRLVVVYIGAPSDAGNEGDSRTVLVDGKPARLINFCKHTNKPNAGLTVWAIDEVGLGSSSGVVDLTNLGADRIRVHAHLYTGVRNSVPEGTTVDLESAFTSNPEILSTPAITVSEVGDLVVAAFYAGNYSSTYNTLWDGTYFYSTVTVDTNVNFMATTHRVWDATGDSYNRARAVGAPNHSGSAVAALFKAKPASYSLPEIHNVGVERFLTDETNVPITGGGFGATQGTGIVVLGDSATYATATKVTQTSINSWADDAIDFNLDVGAITAHDVWLYVVTNSGADVSNAFPIWVERYSTGWVGCPVVEGGVSWAVPHSGVLTEVDAYSVANPVFDYVAYNLFSSSGTSSFLRMGGWDFASSISAGSTLLGLELRIKRGLDNDEFGISDYVFHFTTDPGAVSLSVVGSDFASGASWNSCYDDYQFTYYNTDPDIILGGITLSDLLDPNFAVALKVTNVTGTRTAVIDCCELRVHYEPPTGPYLNSVSDGEVLHGETGIPVAGWNFGDTQGTSILVLGDSATYSTANKVTQTTTSWADQYLEFTVDIGALSPGPLYLYVVLDPGGGGEEVSNPFPLTVLTFSERSVEQRYVLDSFGFRIIEQYYSSDSFELRLLEQRYNLDVQPLRLLEQRYELDVIVPTERYVETHNVFVGGQILLDMLALVNAHRATLGLLPIGRYYGTSENIAQSHSQNLAVLGQIIPSPHDDPRFPVGYQTFEERVSRLTESVNAAAENIASPYIDSITYLDNALLDPVIVFNAWLASPVHRANIEEFYAPGSDPRMLLGWATSKVADPDALAGYNPAVLASTPYAYYRLHEASPATTFADEMGGDSLTLEGTCLYQVSGPLSGGQDTYAWDSNNTGLLKLPSAFISHFINEADSSIEFWFRPSTGGTQILVYLSKVSGGSLYQAWFEFRQYPNRIRFVWQNGTGTFGTSYYIADTADLAEGGPNIWYHFYADRNGPNNLPNVRINGVARPFTITSGTAGSKWFDDLSVACDLMYLSGWNDFGFPNKEDLFLSEVAFYDTEIDADIETHWGARSGGAPSEYNDYWTAYWTQVFIGLGPPWGATLEQRYVEQRYALDTMEHRTLTQSYRQDAYTLVQAQHKTEYALVFGIQHEANWSYSLAVQHSATQGYTLQAQHQTLYDSLLQIEAQNKTGYSLDQYVHIQAQNEAAYSVVLAARNAAVYGLLHSIAKQNKAPYSSTVDVYTQHSTKYGLQDFDWVQAYNKATWLLLDGEVDITVPTATMVYDSEEIDIIECVITAGEGDLVWVANVRIADVSWYTKMKRGDAFTVTLQGEVYSFVVDSKSMDRSGPSQVSMRIDGFSPSTKYRSPNAALIDVEYDTALTARHIVEDILGETVDWGIINWVIPAFRVAGDQVVPSEIARTIVEAVGGLLESNRDGSLYTRNMFPATIPQYNSATPDQVYTDIQHNLSVSEDYEARDDYDCFIVTDGESQFGDSLEWIPEEEDPTRGVVRAYTSPLRWDVEVKYTGGALSSMSRIGVISREEEDLVEFTEGTGSTSYPLHSIVSITWHSTSLGGLSFEVGAKDLTAGVSVNYGYGLATVKYTTKSLNYSVVGSATVKAQFILEDLG